MIARLRGVLAVKAPEGLLIDVHGVGFRVLVSLNAFAALPKVGEAVEVPIHTQMRDSSLELFGFLDESEKSLFSQLIGVSGVGPKMALTILSGMPTEELVTSLADGQVKRLVGIPGVGKRTAERLIVDLQDKVRAISALDGASPAREGARPEAEAVSALVNLGYREVEADRAARDAVKRGASDLAEIIRESLKTLSG